MNPLMMAALVVQLTATGGARGGQGSQQTQERVSGKDVGKHFSALRTEVSSLSQQFREAKERRRREAEQKQRELEGFYEPKVQPTTVGSLTPRSSLR
ncbi:hypothetical protein SAMN05444354_111123 [Stigmatella aurantiaca]|uniref:Uncharacterized protein n=1 Tax=Stigmatella aurantiaca TaxID=41 RepID=A0A1H7VJR5_STIAU|nr:hypothetical protein [Stigmatella aurantiaca]SEM09067.1 hypothetical protein SAMN05444354_111123 [Stigmatella aurantiaca]